MPLKLELEKKTVLSTDEKISFLGAQNSETHGFFIGFVL